MSSCYCEGWTFCWGKSNPNLLIFWAISYIPATITCYPEWAKFLYYRTLCLSVFRQARDILVYVKLSILSVYPNQHIFNFSAMRSSRHIKIVSSLLKTWYFDVLLLRVGVQMFTSANRVNDVANYDKTEHKRKITCRRNKRQGGYHISWFQKTQTSLLNVSRVRCGCRWNKVQTMLLTTSVIRAHSSHKSKVANLAICRGALVVWWRAVLAEFWDKKNPWLRSSAVIYGKGV